MQPMTITKPLNRQHLSVYHMGMYVYVHRLFSRLRTSVFQPIYFMYSITIPQESILKLLHLILIPDTGVKQTYFCTNTTKSAFTLYHFYHTSLVSHCSEVVKVVQFSQFSQPSKSRIADPNFLRHVHFISSLMQCCSSNWVAYLYT
jgi:hypothetical protein